MQLNIHDNVIAISHAREITVLARGFIRKGSLVSDRRQDLRTDMHLLYILDFPGQKV